MSFKDKIGFHKKWHAGAQDYRTKVKYSINEPIIHYIFDTINIKQGFFWPVQRRLSVLKITENSILSSLLYSRTSYLENPYYIVHY